MDIDPLADIGPPRHAIESDSEEEESGIEIISRRSPQQVDVPTRIQWSESSSTPAAVTQSSKTIIALGTVCKSLLDTFDFGARPGWADIGEIKLGDEEVGRVAYNSSTEVVFFQVIRSSKIGIYASRRFAQTILESTSNGETIILDSYPLPTYISTERNIVREQALSPPLRYLTTLDNLSNIGTLPIELFSTPNLITSLTAPLLSISTRQRRKATALLLPARHTAPAPVSGYGPAFELAEDWEAATLSDVLECARRLLGVEESVWKDQVGFASAREQRRKTQVRKDDRMSENGMYI